jgi:hypothetical protein
MLLISLAKELEMDSIVNNYIDIFRRNVFSFLNINNMSKIYGPFDCFHYVVELKHESWRNVTSLVDLGA